MGRSAGIFMAFGSNFRVSNQPTYTPGYTRGDGLVINQRIKIPVAMNGLKNAKTGVAGRDFFQIVAWGKLADFCAKTLNKGRAFDAVVAPHTFQSRYFVGNVPLTGPDGQPVMIDRVAFTIIGGTFRLGEEATELVNEEIRTGRRHQFWNVKNHADQVGWMQLIAARNAIPFNAQSPTFGFAKVVLPNIQAPVAPPANLPGQVAAAFGGGFAPAPVGAPLPAPVNTTFGGGGFGANPVPLAQNTAGAQAGAARPF